jgi:hypothetical protein
VLGEVSEHRKINSVSLVAYYDAVPSMTSKGTGCGVLFETGVETTFGSGYTEGGDFAVARAKFEAKAQR